MPVCTFSKERANFPKGRPQGHPDGKFALDADKSQNGSFTKVYRRTSNAKQGQIAVRALLLPTQTCHGIDFWLEQGKYAV